MTCFTSTLRCETAADLVEQFRLLTDETDSTSGNTRWTNPEILTALSMSQKAVSGLIGGVKRDTVLICVANKVEYTFSATTTYGVVAVWFKKEKNLNPVRWSAENKFPGGKDTTQAKPVNQDLVLEYTFADNKIKIFPALEAYTFDSLYVRYWGTPADFDSLGQAVEMPVYSFIPILKTCEWIMKNNDLSVADETGVLTNLQTIAAMFVARYARRVE